MGVTATVLPGKDWVDNEVIDYTDLRSAAVPSVSIDPQPMFFGRSTGTANALVATLTPAATALNDGLMISGVATADNTGTATLNVNGLGGYAIKKGNNLALEAGDIRANQLLTFLWDALNSVWWLQSGITNKALAGITGIGAGSSGTAYTVTASGFPAALATGQRLSFAADVANTGSATLNVNGLGAKIIYQQGATPLAGGMIGLGQWADLVYDAVGNAGAGAWQLLSGTSAGISAVYCVGGGTANAHTGTVSPAPSSLSDGLRVVFKAIATNTGAATFQLNALGVASPIKKNTSFALEAGDIRAGQMVELIYDLTNTQWQVSTMVLTREVFRAGASTTTTSNYVANAAMAPTVLTEGMLVWFRPDTANSPLATLNFCSLGVKSIYRRGAAAAPLVTGDIVANTVVGVVYDAVQGAWVLVDSPITVPVTVTKMNPALDTNTLAVRYGAGGGTFTVPHGLLSIPSFRKAVLVCTTADNGFSAANSEEMDVEDVFESAAYYPVFVVSADATNVYVTVVATANFSMFNKTTFVSAVLTKANWKLKVYAWL